ncbi:hypothetical protein PV08_00725 [Exophiala spinifera]|uniref:Uncharacterized protein n=1 Tax=Exophiala spinifera TaxID=91928 RepID=A0A0D2BNN8_9EURO|nr:uncharacterized protein PV08_00725 [Exophiala spinifera]KIW20150.1 hypothetical protein PV08_00725 [Exophiala spinifera]
MAETNDQYDLYIRPPTPPDSPLRWKFTPRELASLRHVSTPPGIERQPESELEQEQTSAVDGLSARVKKPKVPFKPPALESLCTGANADTPIPQICAPGAGKKKITDMASAFASQPQCLNSLPGNAERAISGSEPYFHRHETIYKRVFKNGEPVETITQTCEVSGLDPFERSVGESVKAPDETEESLGEAKKNAKLNTKDSSTCEEYCGEEEDGDEEEFAGLFV